MPQWTAVGKPGAERPHAIVCDDGSRIEEPRQPSDPPIDRVREVPLWPFVAGNQDAAVAVFNELLKNGISGAQPQYRTNKSKIWRYRGTPSYLAKQVFHLGIAQAVVDRMQKSEEIRKFNTILAQLCERYHRYRKEEGVPVVSISDLPAIRATLTEAYRWRDSLIAGASGLDQALDEAYEAFAIDPPVRQCWVETVYGKPKEAEATVPEEVNHIHISEDMVSALFPPDATAAIKNDPAEKPETVTGQGGTEIKFKQELPAPPKHPHPPKQNNGQNHNRNAGAK